MKAFKIISILAYGGLLTFATVVAISFGNVYSGWGDGATSSHYTSSWCAWPTAAYFIVSSVAPITSSKRRRRFIFVISFLILVFGFLVGITREDALFISGIVFVLSLVVWAPLLVTEKNEGGIDYTLR